MFSKFQLNNLDKYSYFNYEEDALNYYNSVKREFHDNLEKFIGTNTFIKGVDLQQHWFPSSGKFDIFLSHSHEDEKLALGLAGYLMKKFKLRVFIDSFLWGYANDLLKKIDDIYSINDNGETYNYQKRNYSTGHVHMMLSVALAQMMNNCEALFFLNTDKSILPGREIFGDITTSAWIYYELTVSNLINVRPLNEYRTGFGKISYRNDSIINESQTLKIEYDVNELTKKLVSISNNDLDKWEYAYKMKRTKFPKALDYLYTNIVFQKK